MDSKQAEHVLTKVREKQSLDRGQVFGPASPSFADTASALSRVPVSDVAQGAGAGLFGAGLTPFLDELRTRSVSMGLDKNLKLNAKVAPKSLSKAFINVLRTQKPRLGRGALMGGGIAAVLSALLEKQSAQATEKQGMSVVEGMQEQLQKQLRGAAMRDILGTALLGAGVAGTARGGQGLWNLINRSSNKLRSRSGIAPLPVPYRPTFKDEEEEKEGSEKQAISASLLSKALGSATKRYTAGKIPWERVLQFIRKSGSRQPKLFKGFPQTPSKGMLNQRRISLGTLKSPSMKSRIPSGVPIKPLADSSKLRRGQIPGSRQMAYDGPMLGEYGSVGLRPGSRGGYAIDKSGLDKQAFDMPKPKPTQKGGLWWYMPAMLGAGAAGAYGGWKIIDKILDQRRRKEIEDEVEESRQGFQSALTSQYKEGSDSELGAALDELYSKMQKQADLNPSTWFSPDTKGKALGMYASYAIPSALLGYMVVKGLADKGSTAKILEKAQRRRALKQQKARPAELYAVPTPIEEEEE